MRTTFWATFAISVSVPALAIAQATPGNPERSKETEAAGTPSDGEIVVTAQKREQRLLDVPVAVTAVTAGALVQQNLLGIADYYNRVPGLQFAGNRVRDISIRGITTGGGTSPTIAILVDDVQAGSSTYLGQGTVPDLDPSILDRIEVLRGPQGTLYGASSLGGLIKYATRSPSLTASSGHVEIGAASVDHGGQGFSTRGAVNVPIVRDRVALSVSGFYRRNPAYVDNVANGVRTPDTNTDRSYGGRAALTLKPMDALTIDLSAIRQRTRTAGDTILSVASQSDLTVVSQSTGQAIGDYTTASTLGTNRLKFDLYTARATLDLGGASLTSISGWGRNSTTPVQDVSGTFGFLYRFYPTANAVSLVNADRTNKFSQEVRLAGKAGIFDYLLGGFYTKEHSNVVQQIRLTTGGNLLVTPYAGTSPSSYAEKAVFGDVTAHLGDQIDVQVGGRYARNRQVYTSRNIVDAGAVRIFGPSSTVTTRSRDDAFTWLVTPSFRITPDILAYARVATGYRPGGPNPVVPTIPSTFGSDRVINYELGVKGTALDRAFTYDLSLFQVDWKDIQLQSTDVTSQFAFFVNGSKARSRGAEATFRLVPVRRLTLDANATYTDAELRRALPASTTGVTYLFGNAGDRLPGTARFTGNVGGQYDFPLSDGVDAFVGVNYTYVGKRSREFLNGSAAVLARSTRFELPSYQNVDVRAGFSIDKAWRLNAYVRNVFDTKGIITGNSRNGTLNPAFGTYPTIRLTTPRTVGFVVAADL